MIDGERLHEVRRVADYRLVQAIETDRYGTGFDASAVKHVLQAHAGPERVSHRAVRPLRARHTRLEITPRIARALIDGRKLDPRQRLYIIERQREILIDVAMHRQPKGRDIDLGRDVRPMPTHIE